MNVTARIVSRTDHHTRVRFFFNAQCAGDLILRDSEVRELFSIFVEGQKTDQKLHFEDHTRESPPGEEIDG